MRFVFVHGGFHAGWCWERTIAELGKLGHDAVAVDLPGHGTRVDDPLEEWTIPRRRDAILEVVEPGNVLVGHSGGGFDATATVAADAAVDDVSHIVYLAAALPREGRSYPEAMAMRNSEDGQFATSTTTATSRPRAGRSSGWGRRSSVRSTTPRSRCPTSGTPTCRAVSSAAPRTNRCRDGWPTPSPSVSVSNS